MAIRTTGVLLRSFGDFVALRRFAWDSSPKLHWLLGVLYLGVEGPVEGSYHRITKLLQFDSQHLSLINAQYSFVVGVAGQRRSG